MENNKASRLLTLARGLIEKTDSRVISWMFVEPADYVLELENGAVIVNSVDADGLRPYRLTVLNREREIIETFQIGRSYDDDEAQLDVLLTDLYEIIRRRVDRVDETIDEILTELKIEATEAPGDDELPF